MSQTAPFIHLFKTRGSSYLYDTNRNAVVKLQEPVWNLLNHRESHATAEGEGSAEKQVETLRRKGFLSANRAQTILHPGDEMLEDHLGHKVDKITLQVTQQCNLRCDYCTYSGGYENRRHGNRRMTFDVAKAALDFLFAHSSDNERINIGFYGGEPLLEFDLIKQCVEYVGERGAGKRIDYTLTTNGTLLTLDKVAFLKKNKINLVISLDGPKEIHDQNRRFCNDKGSFDQVIHNLENLHQHHPDYFEKVTLNAVVDPENGFGCIHDFFSKFKTVKEMRTSLNLIAENYSVQAIAGNNQYHYDHEYEYFKLLLCKLGKLDKAHVSKLVERRFNDLSTFYKEMVLTDKVPDTVHHGGPCIPGAQRLFVDITGNFFPCERVSETSEVMNIGNINTGFDYARIRDILNVGKLTEEQCKNCWAFRYCYLCAAFADNLTELSAARKRTHCRRVRQSVESKFKDICVMKEHGFDFHNAF